MYKYFLEVLFSGWEKTALLVFLTLALCVGKKPNVLFVRLGKLAYNEKVFAKNVEFRRNSSSSKTFEWIEKLNLN